MEPLTDMSHWCSWPITAASYIGRPKSNTIMFAGKKLEHLLPLLDSVQECLVFIQTGMTVPREICKQHCIITTDNPALAYARAAEILRMQRDRKARNRKYTLLESGVTVGEGVEIGSGTTLQPGCFVDHDVVVGRNCSIQSGARLSCSHLGQGCVVGQNAVVGAEAFVVTTDSSGAKVVLPSLGNVVLQDGAQIGAQATVCRGLAGDTVVGENTKMDSQAYLAHDVQGGKNCILGAGCVVGGFCEIGDDVLIGMRTVVRNRLTIGSRAVVGMGAVVTKSVASGETVYGNPARVVASESTQKV